MIYKSFPEARVDVLENHFEPTFKPHACVPQEVRGQLVYVYLL